MNQETKLSRLSPILLRLYRFPKMRRHVLALATALEGGHFLSQTLRTILCQYHDVEIGAYSYGSCFDPGAFPGGARIGRYVSVAGGVVRRLNHPLDRLVLHPYFYNDGLEYVSSRTISHEPIAIGHDAWIGQSVIFTEGCTEVGIGAAIGAGSIVTKNVAPFSIVAGNPAREIRRRFDEQTCERILASRWWDLTPAALAQYREDLILPLSAWRNDHPLLCQPRPPQSRHEP